MIKTVFFSALVVVFFFILWVYNPFAHHEEYDLPDDAARIIGDPKAALEGRELFKQNCASCHSLRYDGIYLLSVTAKPEWSKIEKAMGKPIIEKDGDKVKVRGFFVPRDVYEAVAFAELQSLKAFGKVPPDLSTIYYARGAAYLYQFTLNPQKILPGTPMPQPFLYDKEAPEKVAKIVAYLRSVNEPPPREKTKRTLMGIFTVGYFILMGAILWILRKRLV